MDEDFYESYCQWAEECLIWGRGSGNWCRAYSKEEWETPSMFKPSKEYDKITEIPF